MRCREAAGSEADEAVLPEGCRDERCRSSDASPQAYVAGSGGADDWKSPVTSSVKVSSEPSAVSGT